MFKSKWFWMICGLIVGYWMLKDTYQQVQKAAAPDAEYYQPKRDYMVITETDPFVTFDTIKMTNQTEMNIANNVFEGLMRLGKDNIPVYGMAEKYEVSPDYKTYTFYIRKDAKWSDGVPVTANDFKYAWMRALDPKTGSPYFFNFFIINNAKSYYEGKAKANEVGIKIINEKTLQVYLEKPFPQFLSLVASPAFYPQREDIMALIDPDKSIIEQKYVFNGPFIISKIFDDEDSVYLKKNDYYWDKNNVKLNQVMIAVKNSKESIDLFKNKETDLISVENNQQTNNYKNIIKTQSSIVKLIIFNFNDENLKKRDIRLLIKSNINKNMLIKVSGFGFQTADVLIPDVIRKINNFKDDFVEYKRSKNYNMKLNIDKPINLMVIDSEVNKRIGEILKRDLINKLDLNISIQSVDKIQSTEINDFGMLLYAAYTDSADPLPYLEMFHSKSADNFAHYNNPKYDKLIEQIYNETNLEKRNQLIVEAERMLIEEDVVVIPLYQLGQTWLVRENVKNIYFHPFGPSGPSYTLKWATYIPQK